MRFLSTGVRSLVLFVAIAALGSSVHATTLIRAGLEDLVAGNKTVVMAEVLDAVSYWNSEGTFILTDVTVKTVETIKGQAADHGTFTLTLMGGTVGDLTTLIVGGPELIPGGSYVLFLNEESLPGAASVTTVRDLCQGVFEIRATKTGALKAISQANRHPLVPDRQGYVDAPGGVGGFPLGALIQSLRQTVEQSERNTEVTQ